MEAPRVEVPREEAPRMEAPRAEPEPVPVATPYVVTPRAAEAPRVSAPRVDPTETLSSAGLQMVETDRSKAQQPVPEPEPVQLGRPRRERPVAPAAPEEVSLVQVETRNK